MAKSKLKQIEHGPEYTEFVMDHVASFRGIQLGRPELVKTWEKFEQKKSVKAEKEKNSDSELESRFRSISQKQEVRIITTIKPLVGHHLTCQAYCR